MSKVAKQLDWWYGKRELVTNSLVKTSDMNIARILAENLKYIDGKITELELKRVKRRKVGTRMSLRIYRNDIGSRQDAMAVLIKDGWDEIGASEILDSLENDNVYVDEERLLKVSADYRDR